MRQLIRLGMGLWLAGFSALSFAQSCPPETEVGDAILARLKTRVAMPERYREMTVEGFFLNFAPNLHTPKVRERFSAVNNHYVESREQEGVAVVGYVLAVTSSAQQTGNCGEEPRHNVQLWIGAKQAASAKEAKAMRANAIAATLTPAGQDVHAGWLLPTLNRLAQQGAKVRISGWPLYDPEHPEQLGKARGTLWEIYPVMKIEIWANGSWQEL